MGTQGYAAPDGLGCTVDELTGHSDTKVVIPVGTTVARTRLTRPLFAADKQRCALTDWLYGGLEDNPHVPILHVKLHADDVDDVVQACTGRANPTVNKTQRRHVGMEGTALLFAALKPTTRRLGRTSTRPSTATWTPSATWWTASPPCPSPTPPSPATPITVGSRSSWG